jgi:hypothetical protein
MLCRINATINTTDTKAQAINFLRCIRAVCTAAAGSTPSVTPVTAPSTFGAGDCIVEVISNAEAGGWTESSSTTFTQTTPSLTGTQWTTAYNASLAGCYFLDLYNSATGKTTYPYYKQTFATSMSSGNYFSGTNWATYPNMDWSTGFHTATTIDGNYLAGLTYNSNTSATSRNFTMNFGNTSSASAYNSAGHSFRANAGEWLIASTSQYIIIIGSNGIFYWGNRSNAQWENSYTNNPYNFAFSYHCNSTWSAGGLQTTASNINTILHYGYSIDNTGTISASPSWKQGNYQSAYNADPVGGGGSNTTGGANYNLQGYGAWNGYMSPLARRQIRLQVPTFHQHILL